jgi:simple sugar transport system ATP-binding protein
VSDPLLEARGLVKHFGQVQALRGVNFSAYPGEVVALIGDNGAGKSTLVKALSGVSPPDEGEVFLEGRPARIGDPLDARRLGIETVYQDLALAAELDAPANLYLGREVSRGGLLGRFGVLDKALMRRKAVEAFRNLGIELPDISAPVRSLSGGQRQSVAVARAVAWVSKVVFMDEPTAALGVVQRRQVLDVIRRVRGQGVTVVLISHNLPEVLAVADRIEVLRLGRRVARFVAAETSIEELVSAMTGGISTEEAA